MIPRSNVSCQVQVEEGRGVWETRPRKRFEGGSQDEPSGSRDDVRT